MSQRARDTPIRSPILVLQRDFLGYTERKRVPGGILSRMMLDRGVV
jgi:hypothetical protein